MNVSYSQPMLGEHPSSLTELHAQKHQVNPRIHLLVPVSPQHPMHVFVFLHCFFFVFFFKLLMDKMIPVSSRISHYQPLNLQMPAATSPCLRRWGRPSTPRWPLWYPRMSLGPIFSSSSSTSCSCSTRTTCDRGRCSPYRWNRNVICSNNETERSVYLLQLGFTP